jgi:hypothetical protein
MTERKPLGASNKQENKADHRKDGATMTSKLELAQPTRK